MKFLILGAGGVGGTLAGFLANAKEDVTVLVRGETYQNIKNNGFVLKSGLLGEKTYKNVKAKTYEEIDEIADVIFVCVKQYSSDAMLPAIEKAADEHTLIIPVENGFGNGAALAKKLKKGIVLDGAIYVTAYIERPGVVVQGGGLFKLVYGLIGDQAADKVLIARCTELQELLRRHQIIGKFSDDIVRDTMQKFTLISSFAATGLYFDATAGDMQEKEEVKAFFVAATHEILDIAKAMGIEFEVNVLEKNLESMMKMVKDTTSSLQKDIAAGKASEFDEIIKKVIELGKNYHIATPCFEKVVNKFAK